MSSLLSEVRTSRPMVFSFARTWGTYNSIVLIVNRNYRNIQCDSCPDISPMLPDVYCWYKGSSQKIDISPIFQTVAPGMFLYKKILILVDEYRTPSKTDFSRKINFFYKKNLHNELYFYVASKVTQLIKSWASWKINCLNFL